jgi:hypothetical protein
MEPLKRIKEVLESKVFLKDYIDLANGNFLEFVKWYLDEEGGIQLGELYFISGAEEVAKKILAETLGEEYEVSFFDEEIIFKHKDKFFRVGIIRGSDADYLNTWDIYEVKPVTKTITIWEKLQN